MKGLEKSETFRKNENYKKKTEKLRKNENFKRLKLCEK